MFMGCGTALVTPFARDFTLDEETLRKLIQRQIAEGIDFLVPCGTTGESPTLTRSEHLRVVEITVEEAHGKVPGLGGAGGYNPPEVIAVARGVGLGGVGGRGVISGVANQIRGEMSQLVRWCLDGDFAAARALQRQYLPLMEVNFIESSPMPVKAAMGLMGLLEPVFRLPMVPPKPENLEKIASVLSQLGLLSRSVPVANLSATGARRNTVR